MNTDNKCGGDGREDDERREKERRDVAEKMTETEKDVRRPGTKCSTCSTMPGAFDEDESSSAKKKKCSKDHSNDAPEVIAPVEPPMSGFSDDGKDEEKKIDGKGTKSEDNLHVEVMMPVEPPMPGAVDANYKERKNDVMASKRREIVAKIAETEEKKVHRPGACPTIPGAFGVENPTQAKLGGKGKLKDAPEVLAPMEPPISEHVISDDAAHGRYAPESLPQAEDIAIDIISDQLMQSRSDSRQVPPDNDDAHAVGAHAVRGRAFGELPRISPVGETSGESLPAEQRNAGVGEDNLVLPAYVPDENIVQAQRVVPLDTSSNGRESQKPPQKSSYPFHFDKKKCILLTFLLAAVAAITLIVLGVTGHLNKEKADSELEPESGPFIQVGPDLHGLHKGDRFGRRVSLSADGKRLLVSAPALSIQGDSAGGVLVFDINNAGSFSQVGQTIHGLPGDEANGILSGDGRHVAIGSPGYGASENNTNIGRADIFELKDSGSWTKVGGPIFGDAPRDKAGKSVALSFDGSIVAVSAPQRSRAERGKGKVRVYRFEQNAWIQMGSDIVTDTLNDQFGWRVSASDNGMVIAIGARLSSANGSESGQVRVYRYMSEKNSWIQLGSAINGPAAGDHFGADVALSGDGSTVAACAWWHHGSTGTDSGQIRVYSYNNEGEWIRTGTFDGDHELDSLAKISLSRDGKRIATSKGEFDNGKIGYVRVYDYVGGAWRQVDKKLSGHDVHEDFGYATSLSSDGSRMAVGAPAHTADPKRAGIVRVFELPERLS